jgi:Spy/CpxP family protein refolding chaperone
MKRVWMIVLLVSLGLNLGLGLGVLRREGQPPPPSGPEKPFEAGAAHEMAEQFMRVRIELLTRELGLDEDQKAAITDIYQRNSHAVFQRRSELWEQRTRIRNLIAEADATWEQAQPALAEQIRLQSELDSLVVRVMFEERQVLTEDQLERYQRFTGPMLGPHRGDRDGRGRRGPRGEGRPPRR